MTRDFLLWTQFTPWKETGNLSHILSPGEFHGHKETEKVTHYVDKQPLPPFACLSLVFAKAMHCFLPRKLFPPFPFSYEGEWISPCVQSLEASAVLSAAKCTGINVACFAHVHSSAACRFNLHAPGAEPKRVEEAFLHRTHHALPPNRAPAGERICPGDLMSDTAWRARRSIRSLSKRSSVPCAVSVSGIPQGVCTQCMCQALCREHTCPSVGADPSLVLYGYSSGCTGSPQVCRT